MSEVPQDLSAWFWTVPHVGAHFPGAVPRDALRRGGNCQLFAYEVVAHFGHAIPDLCSDELWRDTTATRAVERPRHLDLVLFAKDTDPYGAHVGVVWGHDAVMRLCKEIGRPVIWPWSEFSRRLRYRQIIGYKRPTVLARGAVALPVNPARPTAAPSGVGSGPAVKQAKVPDAGLR